MKEETKQEIKNGLKNAALALAFLGVSIGVLGVCTYRLKAEKESDPTGGLSGGLTVNAGEENGAISLFAAGDVVTNDNGTESTTINVETEYPSDVVVEFSLAWSGTAEWSGGKTVTEYVTATPAEDTRSVTLTCLAAFGDQIVLTATVSGTNNSATATVDYLRKVEGLNFGILTGMKTDLSLDCKKTEETATYKLPSAWKYNSSSSDDTVFAIYNDHITTNVYPSSVSYVESDYTINNTYNNIEVNVRVSEEYVSAAASVGLSLEREWFTVNTQTYTDNFYNAVIKALFFDLLGDLQDGCKTGDYKKVLQALALTTGYDFEVSVGATFEHGGFISTVYRIHIDHTSSDMLSAMALSKDSIIFNA